MKPLGNLILLISLLYILAASAAWQVRNPTANNMTFFTEFTSVMTFKKLHKFQGQ